MKSKKPAKQIVIDGRPLTVLEELEAGSDKRVYQVRDDHGRKYVYKYCRKSTA